MRLRSEEKVSNFKALKEACFNIANITVAPTARESDPKKRDRSNSEVEENKLKGVVGEGIMYRMVGESSLKHYYYRLVNSELYMYRTAQDDEWKTLTHLGYGACV